MCYGRRMTTVATRELRNNTKALLERVEAGEDIVITVAGRPVALLTRLVTRLTWTPRAIFLDRLHGRQADPAIRHDLEQLAGQSTDDIPLL